MNVSILNKVIESSLLELSFLSSRRPHTILQGDWNSDVCSSDLFNGDHTDDILFRNDNCQVATWTMRGGNIASTQIAGAAGPAFHIQGTGDFNGDGRTDILFRDRKSVV